MITEQLTKQAVALVEGAMSEMGPAIGSALTESADGTHSFSGSFKLKLVNTRVYVELTMRHAKKDSVKLEESFEVENKAQLKLGVSE